MFIRRNSHIQSRHAHKYCKADNLGGLHLITGTKTAKASLRYYCGARQHCGPNRVGNGRDRPAWMETSLENTRCWIGHIKKISLNSLWTCNDGKSEIASLTTWQTSKYVSGLVSVLCIHFCLHGCGQPGIHENDAAVCACGLHVRFVLQTMHTLVR